MMARDIEIDQWRQGMILLVPIEGARFIGIAIVPIRGLAVGLRTSLRRHD